MEKSVTLEEALKRIEDLEKENAELREELEYYRNRKLSGRQQQQILHRKRRISRR